MKRPNFTSLLLCILWAGLVSCHDDDDIDILDNMDGSSMDNVDEGSESFPSHSEHTELPSVKTVPYKRPSAQGLYFLETFDGDWQKRWIKSSNDKFSGDWNVVKRAVEAIEGDLGLKTVHEARHHAIAAKFPRIASNEGQTFVLQYEAKFENELNCGGAYMKVFDSSNIGKLEDFNSETPYIIMFGPDRCGATNKVHFILKVKNPISGEWVEHHAKNPPTVPFNKLTHLYTLIIRPDNTYSILVDNEGDAQGSLLTDMVPPVMPAEMIDDPSDKKPHTWVDDKMIADPSAKKPDDWDESAPKKIPDEDAEMPDGWLEGELRNIPDPMAQRPEEWDDEEEGEWQPPTIPNPVCASAPGCGKWEAPLIDNPKYKGKWFAPMINNPEYVGEWKPTQIPNPHYYKADKPHKLAPIDAIGFELWTMQKDLLFDNILIARSEEAARELADETFKVRSGIENAQKVVSDPSSPNTSGYMTQAIALVRSLVEEYPVYVGCGAIGFVLFVVLALFRPSKKVKVETASPKKDAKDSGDERKKVDTEDDNIRQRKAAVSKSQ